MQGCSEGVLHPPCLMLNQPRWAHSVQLVQMARAPSGLQSQQRSSPMTPSFGGSVFSFPQEEHVSPVTTRGCEGLDDDPDIVAGWMVES